MESVLERIGAYIAREGITKGSFADLAKIKRATFYSRMNGETEFTLAEGSKIAKVLGCSVDDLLIPMLSSTEVA